MLSGKIENTTFKTHPVGLSLKANFSWTLAGNVIYAGCQWGMLIVIAKLGSAELVGQFALGLAISAPIIMFANLHLRTVQATDAKMEFVFNHYLGLRLITTCLALVLIIGIASLSAFAWETKLIIMTIGGAKAIESLSDIFYGLMQQFEQMDCMGISAIIKGIISLPALFAGLYWGGSLLLGILLVGCSWFLLLVFYDTRNAIHILASVRNSENTQVRGFSRLNLIRPDFNGKFLKRLAWSALPLGIVVLMNSINVNLPRYFIGFYLGERELGIFAAISYSMLAGFTVVQALGQSAGPRLAQYFAKGKPKLFRKLMINLLAFTAVLGISGLILIWGFGREFLTIIYRPEYALHQDLFLLLAIGAIFGYFSTFLRIGMTAARFFKIQLPIYLLSITISAVICYLFIPRYGLIASGWSSMLSFSCEAFCCGLVVWYFLRVIPEHQENQGVKL